jgi:hypothetical protein
MIFKPCPGQIFSDPEPLSVTVHSHESSAVEQLDLNLSAFQESGAWDNRNDCW